MNSTMIPQPLPILELVLGARLEYERNPEAARALLARVA